MLDDLRAIVARYRPRKRESASGYDGPLSVYREWHALVLGIGVGVVSMLTGTWQYSAVTVALALGLRAAPGPLADVTREPWYALGGLLVGVGLGLPLALVV